ncbi:hypothetical protein QWY16_09360 [Planococcus shenhongbingii]|uniref:hypothetical protein n=1 Tax=Planococcus shenhongbingii TaxID=3058398 RepID=UPI0026265B93|nr:hypothetical protein [Planococcus sp. N016]WKA60291.1 hypothetical protein QWY16_09360 [Planococcus sp. N016]
MLLKYKFKEATTEERQEMLTEIISQYNVNDKSQLIMALAHCQTLTDCSQEEFSTNTLVNLSDRSVRVHKKEYLDIFKEVYEKYKQEPEIKELDTVINEDVMEQVYQNMLLKLSNPSTSAKDLSTLLTYLNISSTELKQYAKHRGATLRSFVKDNEALLIKDEHMLSLVKSILSESQFLYQGTERTIGRTENYMELDLADPIVRLEMQALGLLTAGLWNGVINPQAVEMMQTLRMLKLASGQKLSTSQAMRNFDGMDNRPLKLKPITITEAECIGIYGADEGKEIYHFLTSTKKAVDIKTAVPLPSYEDVQADYESHLKYYSDPNTKPFSAVIAELEAFGNEGNYKEKYKKYLNPQEEK